MPAKKTAGKGSPNVDIQKMVDASIKSGIIRGETTIQEVVDFVRGARLARGSYVIAWDKWVAVIK